MMVQMLKRAYIFVPVAALLLSGAVRGPAEPGRGQALDAPTVKGNVSIQLPKGWVAAGGRALIAAQPAAADKDATGQYQASLLINVDVGGKVDGAAQQAALAKQMPGYRVIEPAAPVVIGGLAGVMFGGGFKSGIVELRSRQYMFAVNNQVFTITFTSLNSKWAAYQGVVEASVGTFAVKK
jgi:hypothetical protein